MLRRIDENGRIVIPKEMCKELNIKEKEQMRITLVDDMIILTLAETKFTVKKETKKEDASN